MTKTPSASGAIQIGSNYKIVSVESMRNNLILIPAFINDTKYILCFDRSFKPITDQSQVKFRLYYYDA